MHFVSGSRAVWRLVTQTNGRIDRTVTAAKPMQAEFCWKWKNFASLGPGSCPQMYLPSDSWASKLIEQSSHNSRHQMGRETKQKLIEVARELFWKKGYHGTSVAEILSRTGANSGSLYHFFPTKQHLLLAVLEWYAENLEAEIVAPARALADDPVDRVFAILDGYRRALLATDFTFGCPIGNLALEFKEPDPPVRELLELNFDRWCDAVEDALSDAEHRFPPDVELDELSRFILTTMEGGVMQARTTRSIDPFDDSVQHLQRYMEMLQETGPTQRPSAVDRNA